jgi:hypothetical protein
VGAALAALALVGAVAAELRATRDRPPPAHTGGFGEPTCHACHFMADVNSGPGALTLSGLPARYTPGASYTVVVELTHPGVAAVGFQVAARFEDGSQAGTLEAGAGDVGRVDVAMQRGVTYAHQREAGSVPNGVGIGRWTLTWIAPATGGTVRFHAAANAADDDSSPLGDYVYTTSAASPPHGMPHGGR